MWAFKEQNSAVFFYINNKKSILRFCPCTPHLLSYATPSISTNFVKILKKSYFMLFFFQDFKTGFSQKADPNSDRIYLKLLDVSQQ
jgi:hypothetical protein